MGGITTRHKHSARRPITIAIFGLDNAGKTTIAKCLREHHSMRLLPTIGFARYDLKYNNANIELYDLGGRESFRDAWQHYYDDCYGFIYVIDSSELDRFDENREVLEQLLDQEKVRDKPVLILANKQDKSNAVHKNTIIENMRIENFLSNNRQIIRMELCTTRLIRRNGKDIRIDPAIQKGFAWLVETIYDNYDVLHNRIKQDVRMRNEILQTEKQKRARRIQEQAKLENNSDSDSDDDIISTRL